MSKLLDDVRMVARLRHFSLRTEQSYTGWIRRYILFHHKRHPSEMGSDEIRSFLADLAVKRLVSASTQTVALSALLFLYRDVLGIELPYIEEIERAKPSKRLPVVFTREEVQAVLAQLEGSRSKPQVSCKKLERSPLKPKRSGSKLKSSGSKPKLSCSKLNF